MSRQNTFTVIPRYNVDSPSAPARPMTSKQVRKAYKAATKQPTMSRAERLKYEKEQQERIRKELEKEKAARKAKAARDKKKEKEAAEAEAKRKMGMPTVRVRPSQDTIAWFVRGKKRDSGGEMKQSEEIIEEEEMAEETSEERAVEGNGEGEVETGVNEDLLDDLDGLDELLDVPNDKEATEDQAEQTVEPQEDESAAKAKTSKIVSPELETPVAEADVGVPVAEPDHDTPRHVSDEELEAILDEDLELDFDDFADEPNLSIDQQKPQTPRPSLPKHLTKKKLTPKPSSPTPKSSSPPSFAPPPSTQAILFNLDSFFPSASQQALELEDFSSPPKTHSPIPIPSFTKPPTPTPKSKPPTPKAPSQSSFKPPPEPSPKHIPQPPKRFFTSSGSTEQLSLALHRSRRTAELEEIRQRDRQRSEAGILLRESKRQCLREQRQQEVQRLKDLKAKAQSMKECEEQHAARATEDKENITPKDFITASQETEYGGDWVDDAAFDLAF